MAVRNGMPYLKEAVNSILKQTYKEFIFIIVDNKSSDGSFEYLNSIKDKRIKLFSSEKIGFVPTINYGLEKVTTKYVATMDADDIAHLRKFEYQIEYLENNPDIGLLGTNLSFFSKNNGLSWSIHFPTRHNDILDGLKSKKYVLSHPTTVMRTKYLNQIGGLREKYKYAPDLDMFLRLSNLTKFSNISLDLFGCRISPKSITSLNLISVIKHQRCAIRDFENNKSELKLNTTLMDYINYLSLYFYKKALFNYLNSSKLFWLLFLALSVLLNPSKAYFHLKKKMGYFKTI
ncbi:MAG: glycosyltransferase [Ignavibacteriales bacterium]|nr:glycosyltransferase [Ignavibacteriales bacterium]